MKVICSSQGDPHMRRGFVVPILLAMLLSACGYHLAGQGDGAGAIPEDVETVSIEGVGAVAKSLLPALKRPFSRQGRYQVVAAGSVVDEALHAVIRIERGAESFKASAYDQSGIATQYRMSIKGNVRLYRAGKLLWESGIITKSGEVFVTGGPAGIEASRKRIREDLRKEWVLTAWSRINSGF